MRRIGALAVLATLFMVGCKDNPAPTPPATSAVAAKSAAAPAKAAEKPPEEHTKPPLCPSEAPGSTTVLTDVDGGIELLVTGKSDAEALKIRRRSKNLADDIQEDIGEHHEAGGPGGKIGRCPVVTWDTNVAFADAPGGSKITVKAKNPADAEWVRRETRDRLAEHLEFAGKEARNPKMTRCPSASPGATTIISDTRDSVVIQVISKDEAVIKDIRERTKLILEAAKQQPKDTKAKGADVGEGLGRCPIIIRETTVTAKEIPLGTEFTVKTDQPDLFEALVKESRNRGEAFLKN